MNNKPILYDYFDNTAKVLLSEYNRSKLQKSSNNIGKNREYFCENFLSEVLPPKLHINSGEIWDSSNNKTGQLDIVIIRDDAPSLLIGSDNIFLAEGVFAVVEVKSNLSKDKLIESGNSLSKVEKLKIKLGAGISVGYSLNRPLRIVFAYEGASWKTIVSTINEKNWKDTFDLICILNRGVMITKGRIISWDENDKFLLFSSKASSLAYLYFYLVSYANSFLCRDLKLLSYFEPLSGWNK